MKQWIALFGIIIVTTFLSTQSVDASIQQTSVLEQASSCVEDVVNRLQKIKTIALKKQFVRKLSANQMKCLYLNTKNKHIRKNEFLKNRLYFEKSDLPVFSESERTFRKKKNRIIGINDSPIHRFLDSPGIHEIRETQKNKLVFHYQLNAKHLVRKNDLKRWSNKKEIGSFEIVKANQNDVLYQNKIQFLKKIDQGVYIGRTGTLKDHQFDHQNYFVLLAVK